MTSFLFLVAGVLLLNLGLTDAAPPGFGSDPEATKMCRLWYAHQYPDYKINGWNFNYLGGLVSE